MLFNFYAFHQRERTVNILSAHSLISRHFEIISFAFAQSCFCSTYLCITFKEPLNISQNTVSQYETGIRLAEYFNVSIDYLLERTDDPTFHKK